MPNSASVQRGLLQLTPDSSALAALAVETTTQATHQDVETTLLLGLAPLPLIMVATPRQDMDHPLAGVACTPQQATGDHLLQALEASMQGAPKGAALVAVPPLVF